MAASVNAVRVRPLAEGFLAVEENQNHVVHSRRTLQHSRKFQQQARRRSTIVRSDKLAAFEGLGIEVSRDDNLSPALPREPRQNIFHRDRPSWSLRSEGVFGHIGRSLL